MKEDFFVVAGTQIDVPVEFSSSAAFNTTNIVSAFDRIYERVQELLVVRRRRGPKESPEGRPKRAQKNAHPGAPNI